MKELNARQVLQAAAFVALLSAALAAEARPMSLEAGALAEKLNSTPIVGSDRQLTDEVAARLVEAAKLGDGGDRDPYLYQVALYGLSFLSDEESQRLLESAAQESALGVTRAVAKCALLWRRTRGKSDELRVQSLMRTFESSEDRYERLFLVTYLGAFLKAQAGEELGTAFENETDPWTEYELAVVLARGCERRTLEAIVRKMSLRKSYEELGEALATLLCIMSAKDLLQGSPCEKRWSGFPLAEKVRKKLESSER